jgi:hypothetical protein
LRANILFYVSQSPECEILQVSPLIVIHISAVASYCGSWRPSGAASPSPHSPEGGFAGAGGCGQAESTARAPPVHDVTGLMQQLRQTGGERAGQEALAALAHSYAWESIRGDIGIGGRCGAAPKALGCAAESVRSSL